MNENEIGSKWKELSEEERRPFQERYDRDRERYLEQEKQRMESRRLIGIPEIRKKRGIEFRRMNWWLIDRQTILVIQIVRSTIRIEVRYSAFSL